MSLLQWALFALCCGVLCSLTLCSAPRSVAAHEAALSVLSVDVGQQRLEVLLDLDVRTLLDVLPYDDNDNSELEAQELDASAQRLVEYIDTKLSIRNAGLACSAGEASVELTNKRRVWVKRSYVCPEQPAGGGGSTDQRRSRLGELSIENSVFMEDRGGHRVVAKFVIGARAVHHVFLPETTKFKLDASEAPDTPGGRAHPASAPSADNPKKSANSSSEGGGSFLGWVREGVKHIALGFDHIAFVIGLLVVVRRFRDLALVVSAFTIAHSITLALGATGMVRIEPRLVESLIAVSIVYVALDNYLGWRSGRFGDKQQGLRRHYLTFAFGLVHGFGFASVLTDLGLPSSGLLSALFGFNVGVELGQLAFVAPLFPLVQYLQRSPQRYAWTIRVSSVLIGGLGALWLIERVLDRAFLPF